MKHYITILLALLLCASSLTAQDPQAYDIWVTGPGLNWLPDVVGALEFSSWEYTLQPFADSLDVGTSSNVRNLSTLGGGVTITFPLRIIPINGLRFGADVGIRLQTGAYETERAYRSQSGDNVVVMDHTDWSLPVFRIAGTVGYDISHYRLTGIKGLGDYPLLHQWYSLVFQAGFSGSFIARGRRETSRRVMNSASNALPPEGLVAWEKEQVNRAGLEITGAVAFEFRIGRNHSGSLGLIYTHDLLSSPGDGWMHRSLSLRTGFGFKSY